MVVHVRKHSALLAVSAANVEFAEQAHGKEAPMQHW